MYVCVAWNNKPEAVDPRIKLHAARAIKQSANYEGRTMDNRRQRRQTERVGMLWTVCMRLADALYIQVKNCKSLIMF